MDGQGGGLGAKLVNALLAADTGLHILAVGTNAAATMAMLEAGAKEGATGENAVLTAARRADIILGPLGIVLCDALMGEISPRMAQAVCQSAAQKVLIPTHRCGVRLAGLSGAPLSALLQDAVDQVKNILTTEQ